MFSVSSSFIGNFKTGDNINYNLDVVALLYSLYANASPEDRNLLRKPITVTLVSITEAMLHDFHMRVQVFTLEGVANLAQDVAAYIRGKKLDIFERYIVSARKHDLLGMAGTRFYDRMDELRRLRNRIHIQNANGDFEPDESAAFSDERKVLAERVLEKTAKVLASKYPRKPNVVGYVRDFSFPWVAHFEA